MSDLNLNDREIKLIEELGVCHRIMEIHKLIETALVARLGGVAHITHDEIEFARKTYNLTENIHVDDYMAEVKLETRLK